MSDVLSTLLGASLIALVILITIGTIVGWVMARRIIKPLATMKTMIDVTLDDPDSDVEALRGLAERIRDVNESNIETVEALLDLGSITGPDLVQEPIELAELVSAAAAALEDEIRTSELSLTTQCSNVWVMGNPVLLRQAISNLLRNAIRHNHIGGDIAIEVSRVDDRERVAITNSGDVVTAEISQRLREPFLRAEGRTQPRVSGHGLGLAIVDAVAAARDRRRTRFDLDRCALTTAAAHIASAAVVHSDRYCSRNRVHRGRARTEPV